ncbi:pyrethroid hydrolase Ces2a-like [Ruditapes philippinarum]|uniref:pyrethroid hydrolase Ces2a-like n=1 Tax=Ruditapes philippinarum TaxID=129788 RepID=UPI00295B7C71|nr:pyrethroid hydrolase Ces2a-like [Ruditapes philippinarum]
MDEITVETKIGSIKGEVHVRTIEPFGDPLRVRQFLGVPYAEPPIGALRFEKPKMKHKMNEVYDATKYGPSCLQMHMDFLGERKPASETGLPESSNDCLVLNIFSTPDNLDGNTFGGDPNKVTLFGGSAGGASVIFQAMYPGNKGLIKRIIPQSGSVTCPWVYQRDSLQNAKRIANLVGCPTDVETFQLASCLRKYSR